MTSSEEKYLKNIYHLAGETHAVVSTNAIAERVATQPASVTDMIKKLAKKGLVGHRRYKGVNLTEKGRSVALSILRKQRLWEVFLAEKLDISKDAIPELAEQLEHMASEELIDKLDRYLGFPKIAPTGEPIPSKDGEFKKRIRKLLNHLPVGAEGICVAVKDSSAAFNKFLEKNRIAVGSHMRILDKEEFDNSLGLQIGSREIRISEQIASNLYLEVVDD